MSEGAIDYPEVMNTEERSFFDVRGQIYNEAAKLYNSGKYAEAAAKFEEAGDYENSRELALESKYQVAAQLFNAKEYQKAAEKFSEIKEYGNPNTVRASRT